MYIGYARISSKIIFQMADTTQWGGTKLNYDGTFGLRKKGDNNVILCTKATYPIVLYDYALHSMQSIICSCLSAQVSVVGLSASPRFQMQFTEDVYLRVNQTWQQNTTQGNKTHICKLSRQDKLQLEKYKQSKQVVPRPQLQRLRLLS